MECPSVESRDDSQESLLWVQVPWQITVDAEIYYFIVQSESCDYIKEALQILKTWNPNWHPKLFMTDYSEAEIGALEGSFPDTTVYLCDFHREQAWERWVHDKKHGLSSEDAEWLVPVHGRLHLIPV